MFCSVVIVIFVSVFVIVQLLKLIKLIELSEPPVELLDDVALGLQLALERLLARVDFHGGAFALEAEKEGACVLYVLCDVLMKVG